jgi:hypothetical protein
MLKYCLPIFGLMCEQDLLLFKKYQNHNGFVVNLGVYYGKSLYEFCQIYGDEKVIGIDVFNWMSEKSTDPFPTREFVVGNLSLHRCKPTVIQCDSRFPPDWIKDVGVLFIDTCHTSDVVREEIKSWMPRLREDALVFFHDYWPYKKCSYTEAIDDAMKDWRKIDRLGITAVFGRQ